MITITLIILFTALQIADVITTNHIIKHGGVELNKFVAYAMRKMGKYWWTIKLAPVGLLCLLGSLSDSAWVIILMSALCAIYTWVVSHNLKQIYGD